MGEHSLKMRGRREKNKCLGEAVIQSRTSEELHTRGHKLCRGNKVCSGGRSGDIVNMSVGGGTI